MKILLSAYSCGATKTSEPGVAWRFIHHAISEGHEVWAVIQKSGYEKDFTTYLAENPLPGFHPIFMDLSPIVVALLRRGGPIGSVYYHLWQEGLVAFVQKLHKKVGFDLSHHITFGRYWSPSGLRGLDIPFIWGPVGAAESTPPAFLAEMRPQERLFEWTRDTVRSMAPWDRSLIATAKAATIGIGVTRETCEALRTLGVKRVELLPQASLAEDELDFFERFPLPPPGPFRAICMGRLLHWKGFQLAIRAFAIFAKKNLEAELWIVNNGPYRKQLEEVAAQSGVADRIRFFGHLPSYADVLDKLAQAHVLMHPALHEAFGSVCMEAMAAGRPVVCLDIGGPASQVTPETGFIAPANNPTEALEAMANFLTRVANDRQMLQEMAVKARAHVRKKFAMTQLGAAITSLYREAVEIHAKERCERGKVRA
jgi:glycosyltransferase involved in cell wall biosynthesis